MRTAAYARYSSDQQREQSIRDQLRNCAAYCERMGWPEPEPYSDEAVSGSLRDRPGYQRLLDDARAHAFDVLLVDDLSRLSRDQVEATQALRLMQYRGIRVIGISDGVDTDQRGYKLQAGVRGLMAELYLDDLAEKTHRGLTGQALAGYSAGGLPYGYRSVDDHDGHRREIDEDAAPWVRWIFERYAAGWSPRRIASDLNERGVPSPRGGKWSQTAIYGDAKRGTGILNQPLYAGKQVWNRSRWVKDPADGKRKRKERPESEWIITEHEDLRVVDQATWDAVKARQRDTRARTRKAQEALGRHARLGRGPKYVLSGLLQCGVCGGNYVIIDRYRYGCGRHRDRGPSACTNSECVPRRVAEERLLEHIKTELLSEEAYQLFAEEVRRLMVAEKPDPTATRREVAEAEREIENIMAAIRQGIITPSTRSALEAAEARRDAAKDRLAAIKAYEPTQVLPRAREIYQGWVRRLEELDDVAEAREAVREITGVIRLIPDRGLVAQLQASGLACQLRVVAGAGFETYLTGELLHVRLTG